MKLFKPRAVVILQELTLVPQPQSNLQDTVPVCTVYYKLQSPPTNCDTNKMVWRSLLCLAAATAMEAAGQQVDFSDEQERCMDKCIQGVSNAAVMDRATCDAALLKQTAMFECVEKSTTCTPQEITAFTTAMSEIQLTQKKCEMFAATAPPGQLLNADGGLSRTTIVAPPSDSHSSSFNSYRTVFAVCAGVAVGAVATVLVLSANGRIAGRIAGPSAAVAQNSGKPAATATNLIPTAL